MRGSMRVAPHGGLASARTLPTFPRMPKPHEIFALMPAETATKLFHFLTETEKPLYKATIDTLAKQRKLRPVFVERKPRTERNTWLKDTLSRKQSEAVAAHLLQIWLVGEHKQLLCDFLDALNITHDADGTIEALPPCPPKEDLVRAIDTVLTKHDPAIVSVYLQAFQATNDDGWTALTEILATDERLRFGTPTRAAA